MVVRLTIEGAQKSGKTRLLNDICKLLDLQKKTYLIEEEASNKELLEADVDVVIATIINPRMKK